jgi:hypothetical protein
VARFLGNESWSTQSDAAWIWVTGDVTTISMDLPTQPIPPGPRTVHVTLDPDPGEGVLQWSLYPSAQSGEVPIGPGGAAQIDLTELSVGDYILDIIYPGSDTRQRTTSSVRFKVRPATTTTLTTDRTVAYVGEAAPVLKAFVTTADSCTDGTLTIMDDAGSGPVELATPTASICAADGMGYTYVTNALAIGTHNITARFDGGTGLAPSTSEPVVITVSPDTAVHASFKPSSAKVFAYRDGYRDTVTLGGKLDELANVTIRIYTSGGSLKRTWKLGSKDAGSYGVKWNGTTSSGSRVAAGKYTAKATFKDALGHTRTITGKVTVSWRQAAWKTGTVITKYGDQFAYYANETTGHLFKSPDYPRGRTMDAGEMDRNCDPCAFIYGVRAFQLNTKVIAYRKIYATLYGHGYTDRDHPGTGYAVDPKTGAWEHGTPLPEYMQSGVTHNITIPASYVDSSDRVKVVLYMTQKWGDAWDVHALKLHYQYAVWK